MLKDITILGIESDSGEIIYSRFQHDYRESYDKSVFIDGGREYSRYSANGKLHKFKIENGEWVEYETRT
jgi:hypothetical protein